MIGKDSLFDNNFNILRENSHLKSTEKIVLGKLKNPAEVFHFIREGDFDIVWRNVAFFAGGHLLLLIGFVWLYHAPIYLGTHLWLQFIAVWSCFGVVSGAHRLWTHRSYKAKLPLKLFLAMGHSIAGQNCIYIWARDHRLHHKYSDTDADPHSVERGLFFSHVGWLLKKKHPEVIKKGKTLDMSDLLADPIVYYNKIFYYPIYFFCSFFIPVMVPVFFWEESVITSFFLNYLWRTIFVLHATWFVNSAAHHFGSRPYNGEIRPAENVCVSMFAFGEGYHNFHHTFPYDYSTSELPYVFNVNKFFIELMSRKGLAYDLKRASVNSIQSVKLKTEKLKMQKSQDLHPE